MGYFFHDDTEWVDAFLSLKAIAIGSFLCGGEGGLIREVWRRCAFEAARKGRGV